jgi:hypothetical protein
VSVLVVAQSSSEILEGLMNIVRLQVEDGQNNILRVKLDSKLTYKR